MEFVELMKNYKRMCKSIACCNCDLNKLDMPCEAYFNNCAEKIEQTVTEWVKQNPVKTRADVFKEQYPDSEPLNICVQRINSDIDCISSISSCTYCQQKFWNEVVE